MHGCWQFHHDFYRFGAASYAIEKCIFVDLQLKGCIELGTPDCELPIERFRLLYVRGNPSRMKPFALSERSMPGLESWRKLNAEYVAAWPNITIKRQEPADAKTFDGVAGKLEQYFSASLHPGSACRRLCHSALD
jgi:hypothetical protein